MHDENVNLVDSNPWTFQSIGRNMLSENIVGHLVNASSIELPISLTPDNTGENSTANVTGTVLSDSQVISSMRLNAVLGSSCVLIFGVLNAFFKMYRLRLSLKRVTVKPPTLPKRGWKIFWMWLWCTCATPDETLLTTSGLDALMLVKTFGLGVQLFFPLTVIGSCLLIPIHKDEELMINDERTNSDSFLRMTISNVKKGSDVYWAHFLCVYLYILYALLLLYFHQKRFIRLRHRFLNAQNASELARADSFISHYSAERRDADQPISVSDLCRNFIHNTIEVLGRGAPDPAQEEGAFARLATLRADDTKKLLERYNQTQSFIRREPMSSPSSPAGAKSAPLQGIPGYFSDSIQEIPRAVEPSQDTFTFAPTSVPSSRQESFEIQESTSEPAVSTPFQRKAHENLTVTIAPSFSMQESNVQERDTPILKWWLLKDGVTEVHASSANDPDKKDIELSRPSVRFLKTVDITDPGPPEKHVTVAAQQYCALLTNFPSITKPTTKTTRINDLMQKFTQLVFGKNLDHTYTIALDNCGKNPIMNQAITEALRIADSSKSSGQLGWSSVRNLLKPGIIMEAQQKLIDENFQEFFPNDFVRAVPVRNHKELDILLLKWDATMGLLERSNHHNEHHNNRKKLRRSKWWSFICFYHWGYRDPVDAVEFYTNEIHELENQIKECREKIMKQYHAASWILIFKTQKAASIVSQVLLHTEDGNQFRVGPMPGPDEINWQSLWKNKRDKDLRFLVVIPFVVLLISFPLGIFAGSLSRLTDFLCGDPDDDTHWGWYCEKSTYRKPITAWVPAILVTIWQNMIMPNALYYLVQASAGCDSLSQLERRIASLFFMWDVGNIFLGAMLGGSVFYQINNMVKKPQDLMSLLGVAVPASSNFFVNYVILRTFFLLPWQLLVPHPGIWYYLFRCGGRFGFSGTPRDRAMLWAPRSIRYGREYGVILLMFLIAIAYSVVAPIILPITLAYFMMAWLVWRYQVMYVYVRKYESGGRMWPLVVSRLIFSLWVFQFFTSCVLLTKEAYWQASILWITVPIILRRFYRYCDSRFRPRLHHIPLEMAQASPSAEIDPRVYTAPALLEDCAGWHPEYMKAWEGWGSPSYTL